MYFRNEEEECDNKDFKNLQRMAKHFAKIKKGLMIPLKSDFSLTALLAWVQKTKKDCSETHALVDCILNAKLPPSKMNGKSVAEVYQSCQGSGN